MNMRTVVVVVVIAAAVLGLISCKKQVDRADNKDQKAARLEGPCAAERDAATQAWDRVASDIETMRDGILKERVVFLINEQEVVHNKAVNREECRGLIDIGEAPRDKARAALWKQCNDDARAAVQAGEDLRRLMQDKARLKTMAQTTAKEARDLAAKYRAGAIGFAETKPVVDHVTPYYGAASRVQSVGPHCVGNDCLSDPASTRIQYDMKPVLLATQIALASCPASTTTGPGSPASEPCARGVRRIFDAQAGKAKLSFEVNGHVLLEIPNCTDVCLLGVSGGYRVIRDLSRGVEGFVLATQVLDPDDPQCKQGGHPSQPPPTPNTSPQPADEKQGQGSDEKCTPKLVLDPDPKGTGGNLRAEPTTDGYVLTEIPNCTEVCEVGSEGDWKQVRATPRDIGYMHKSQLAAVGATRCKGGNATPAPPPKQQPTKSAKPTPPPPPTTPDMFQ